MSTGANTVIERLLAGGVDVCFANPGTSEMHFVAALDSAPKMRPVLCLFEGVATGAADGYARIAGRPAATLLHLGPGMANGLANLHNARRAHSPVVNVVGDHATYHQKLDAPLQSDIDILGNWLHGTVHRPVSAAELGETVDAAIASATHGLGRIATLILPADLSWSESSAPGEAAPTAPPDVHLQRDREIPTPASGPARRGPHLDCHRRQGAGGDVSRPAGARQGRARYPTPRLPRRTCAGAAQGHNAFDLGRFAIAGNVLCVSEYGKRSRPVGCRG
jgi:hypothetical protein